MDKTDLRLAIRTWGMSFKPTLVVNLTRAPENVRKQATEELRELDAKAK